MKKDKFAIERLEGRGLTAVVTDTGKLYSTYEDFAKASGYPDATVSIWTDGGRDKSEAGLKLQGTTVRILAKGKHGWEDCMLYVVESDEGERFLFGADGLKIKEASGMYTIEARYEKAVEEARKAVEELRLAALAKGYEDARRELTAVAPVGHLAVRTPQQQRDVLTRERIIEQAKRDVAELLNDGCAQIRLTTGLFTNSKAYCKAEFIVNAEKRTVVVLMKGFRSKRIRAKGIAKCAPTDCFNAHIGKAIAVRRALGLEVPAEYTNAPQPTEVRVGDKVRLLNVRINMTVDTEGLAEKLTGQVANGVTKIIDDTRDEVTR